MIYLYVMWCVMCSFFAISYTHIHTWCTNNIQYTGITVIETDVEGKNVVVTHDDSVSQDSILDKLQKVCVNVIHTNIVQINWILITQQSNT